MRPRSQAERLARLAAASLLVTALGGCPTGSTATHAAPAVEEVRAVGDTPAATSYRVRVFLGGGPAARWTGTLSVTAGSLTDLRLLGDGYDAPAQAHLSAGAVQIHTPRPATRMAMDVTLAAPPSAELLINLQPRRGGEQLQQRVAISQLIAGPLRTPLGESGAELLIHRAAADSIRVNVAGEGLVFRPGDTLTFATAFVLPELPDGSPFDCQAELLTGRAGPRVWSSPSERQTAAAASGPTTRRFEIPLPTAAGVYTVRIAAWRPPGSVEAWLPGRTGVMLAERRFQVVVDDPAERLGPPAEWQTVYELDPTVSRWWDRLPRRVWRRRAAWLPEGPLGVGGAEVVAAGAGRVIQLPPADGETSPWQAYPLRVQQPGAPHMIELEYPADTPQELVLAVYDVDERGVAGPLGDGALASVGRWHTASADGRIVRGIFWPRTASPLLVVANGSADRPVRFGRLRVKQIQRRDAAPSTHREEQIESLTLLGEVDLPARYAADRRGEFGYDDWVTFRQTARRLADGLQAHQHRGVVLNVASAAGTMYPSNVFGHQPSRDRELILSGVIDVPRKDGLELILREFDRRGLRLYPALRMDGVFPACVGPNKSAAADLFTLDDAATRQVLRAVDELIQRYGGHASLAGVAIDLSRQGYLRPPGEPDRLEAWVALIEQLAKRVNRSGQGRRLVVLPPRVPAGTVQAGLLPKLGADEAAPTAAAVRQLRRRAAEMPSLRVATPRYAVGLAAASAEAARLEANRRADTQAEPVTTPLVVLPTKRVTLRDFERVSPFGANQTRGEITVAPIGAAAADALGQAMARSAPAAILQAGAPTWEVLNGATARERAWRPAGLEAVDLGRGQSVAVYAGAAEGRTTLTLASSSPWPCRAQLTIRTARACVAHAEGADQRGPLSFGRGEHVLTADLAPYAAAQYAFDSPDVSAVGLRTEHDAAAAEQLTEQLADLRRRNLAAETPFEGGPSPSFESHPPGAGLGDWHAVPAGAAGVTLARDDPADGEQAVRLTSSGPGVGVESGAFAAPKTGQLAVVFRVRTADIGERSELRVVFEQPAGPYRSFTVMGAEQLQPVTSWKSFVFAVNDVPLGGPAELRLRFELAGGGQVDVDHLQMYDLTHPLLFLGSVSAKQKLELLKPIQSAENALSSGRLEDCRRVLDGYWPRFVAAHVPVATPAPELAERPADPQAAEEKKPKQQPRTALGDRVRSYLPFFR